MADDDKSSFAESLIMKLNPKTQSLDMRVQGLRSIITPSDVAAALAGLPSISMWIVRAWNLSDRYAVEFIKMWLTAVAIRLSSDNHWGIPYEKKVMLAEFVHGDIFKERCQLCKGRTVVPELDTGLPATCPKCDGRGYMKPSILGKAREFGISEQAYHKLWKARERDIMREYSTHEFAAIECLERHFGLRQ